MKIAAIVVTYNDDYKLEQWFEHYLEYKEVMYKYIIVDNGSGEEYLRELTNKFKDAVIIKRKSNGGCTGAYNDGIKYALQDCEVDSILLIANDIKITAESIKALHNFLYEEDSYGMVSPVLLRKDSNIVDDFGCEINRYLHMKPKFVDSEIESVDVESMVVEAVTGGMNLSKRLFYENVGNQDNKLFMYSDEVDMALRAKAKGWKLAVTKKSKSWHQHINPLNRELRLPYSAYLIGRNKVYLARKHFGLFKIILVFSFAIFKSIFFYMKSIRNPEVRQYNRFFILGAWRGLLNDMTLPKKIFGEI